MLTKEYDNFIQERMEPPSKLPSFVAELSNGETVYQDDGRYVEPSPFAWLRLKHYLTESNLNIEKLWLQYRSNKILVSSEAEGLYFCKGLIAGVGGDSSQCFVVGILKDGGFAKLYYSIPDLQLKDCFQDEVDYSSELLILRQ